MPRVVDHEMRRVEISRATWQAIDELGIEGTSLRAIATRAGCTIGRLTHYFASREDLLVEALRQAHVQAAQRMSQIRESRQGRDALREVLLDALPLDEIRRREWRVWLAFWAAAVTVERLRDENETRYREWTALVSSLVSQVDQELTARDVKRVAEVLVRTVDGVGLATLLDPSAQAGRSAQRTIDDLLSALLPSREVETQRPEPS